MLKTFDYVRIAIELPKNVIVKYFAKIRYGHTSNAIPLYIGIVLLAYLIELYAPPVPEGALVLQVGTVFASVIQIVHAAFMRYPKPIVFIVL